MPTCLRCRVPWEWGRLGRESGGQPGGNGGKTGCKVGGGPGCILGNRLHRNRFPIGWVLVRGKVPCLKATAAALPLGLCLGPRFGGFRLFVQRHLPSDDNIWMV